MINTFFKSTLAVATLTVLAACGSDNILTPSTGIGSGTNTQNQGDHVGIGHESHIKPGSLADYHQNIGDHVFFDTAEYLLSPESKRNFNASIPVASNPR